MDIHISPILYIYITEVIYLDTKVEVLKCPLTMKQQLIYSIGLVFLGMNHFVTKPI